MDSHWIILLMWLKINNSPPSKLSSVVFANRPPPTPTHPHPPTHTHTQNLDPDDDLLWLQNMMTSSNGFFSALLAICAGNSPVDRWILHTKASVAELWCFLWSAWINGWVNNGEAGDLTRHLAYYDVTVIIQSILPYSLSDISCKFNQNPWTCFWEMFKDKQRNRHTGTVKNLTFAN